MLLDPAPLAEQHAMAAGLGWRLLRGPPAADGARRPGLLLLHGTGSSAGSWLGSARHLAADWELLIPDLPGHGGTSGFGSGAASLPRMAQALAALLKIVDAPPLVAAAGHSAGAALMLQLWLDGALPAARGLVAINGALLPLPGVAGRLFPPLARLMSRLPGLPHVAAKAAARPAALQHLVASTGSRLDADGLAHYRALLAQPAHIAGALQMMAGWDVQDLLPALQRRLSQKPLPLLLAAGERDRTVEPDQSRRLALALPGARYLPLPGLGHLAHEEQPTLTGHLLAMVGQAADPSPRRRGPETTKPGPKAGLSV